MTGDGSEGRCANEDVAAALMKQAGRLIRFMSMKNKFC